MIKIPWLSGFIHSHGLFRLFLGQQSVLLLLLVCSAANAQTNFSPNIKSFYWISHPSVAKHSYSVLHFRKTFQLSGKPESFLVDISADTRYRFFVNGKSVAVGPARSDVQHWRYATLDISPYLIAGKNVLAAVVWNDGENMAWPQMSYQTGLYLHGKTGKEAIVNTDTTWKVIEDNAYSPVGSIAHITGAFENMFAQRYYWSWEEVGYDDTHWLPSVVSEMANFASTGAAIARILTPGKLPMPEEKTQRFVSLRQSAGPGTVSDDFLKGSGKLSIHPWANVVLLIDQGVLTTAYPKLLVSGGRGAKITLTYAESLFDEKGNKGNRDSIANKKIRGDHDSFLADGGANRLYSPLYYRTFRYVELTIENHQEALELNDFYSVFTAYPFVQNASFVSDDTVLNKIFETGWRTARLCAFETYIDCPYYEQLQYVGDTRIQALISLYVSGDDRLMRNAIEQINYSLLPEGITQSRYPSSNRQVIPPFSLLWISMIHDYWMHRKDDAFVKQFLPSIRKILAWHRQFINANTMLGPMPYWNFVDWPKQWPWTGTENESGIPDGTKSGNSSILTLQYVMALQKAADLFKYFQLKDGNEFLATADRLKKATYACCWNNSKGLLANTDKRTTFSQHAQALGILTGVFPLQHEKQILQQTLSDSSLVQCTYYYKFYLLQALTKAGMGDEYVKQLYPWKQMLALGLTTFAEAPEPTRSDCHAWSASPCYDLLATVCGIRPAAPGFRSVIVQPHLGELTSCSATVPHPPGVISVAYHYLNSKWKIEIHLPKNVTGVFEWKGKKMKLLPGANAFRL